MGELKMSRLKEELVIHNIEMGSALVIQNIGQTSIRIDKFDIHCQKMFLKYSPLMFFVASTNSSILKLELMTYNEEVFDIFTFSTDDTASEELFQFIMDKFKNVSYSNCSGIKKENIRNEKLERYVSDTDTLFERFGDSFIFRSINCKRIIENESTMDLCDECKTWLLFKETRAEDLAEVKLKVEDSGDEEEDNYIDNNEEDEPYEPPGGVKGGKKRSPAWQHFTDLVQDNMAECRLCHKGVSYGTTRCTTGLLKHIRIHHNKHWDDMQFKKPSVKQNALPLPLKQKRSKPRKSLVWQYFSVSKTESDHSVCEICQTSVGASNGNTTGMWAHMRRKHPEIDVNNSSNGNALESVKTDDYNGHIEDMEEEDDDDEDYNREDDEILCDIEETKTENLNHNFLNSSENLNTSPRKLKSRSLVWNFFTKSLAASSQCTLCGKEICTVGNNTSGMIKHLVSIHPELDFQNMMEREKEDKQTRKEQERISDSEAGIPVNRPTTYPKSSPAWKYFTISDTIREMSVCNLCQAEVSCVKKNTSGMLKHLLRWHPDTDIVLNKREQCSQCQRKFFFKKTLIKHLKVDHGTDYRKFQCPEEGCEVFFRLFKGKLMRRHLSEVHGETFNLKEGMYSCEQCDKKFKSFDVLAKHIKGVHESIHVPCYICAKLVKEGTPMEHHIKYVHLQPNKFSCDQPGCGFTTRHKDTLLDHQTKHTGTKRWCCGTCGKEHRLRSGLYLCEKMHEGYDAWQHVCTECSKRFISKQKLVMHMRMHTGEKPFWCPVCRFRSARMSNLNAHIKKSHGMSWKDAEIRYGISAKTGQPISRDKLEGMDPLSSNIAQ